MSTTENNNMFANNTERAIKAMGLESYTVYVPREIALPEQITPAEVSALISKALKAGKDPAEDPKIKKAIIQRGIAEHTLTIRLHQEQEESARRVNNIKTQAPKLIKEMKAKFDTAAKELQEAHKILGNEPIWDQTAYFPAHERNWPTRLRARAAHDITSAIIQNWGALMQALEGPLGITAPIQTYAEPTLNDHDRHGLALGGRRSTGGNTGVWDMLEMGIKVDLATSNEQVRGRVAAVREAKARREASKITNGFQH
ncbi:hypothetical protein ACIOJF_15075 [Glutamicibacter sp. NPDC087831]|uniref:hypothetical protein n=1 Tax=Glutamicibacter sp. NPDC087831 TaxID=3363998 RepID=UPI003807BB71